MEALAKGEHRRGGGHARGHWLVQQNPSGCRRVRRVAAFEDDPNLNWNVAVGMISPDEKLTQGVDAALEALLADGTLARIYARYGIELQRPQ